MYNFYLEFFEMKISTRKFVKDKIKNKIKNKK